MGPAMKKIRVTVTCELCGTKEEMVTIVVPSVCEICHAKLFTEVWKLLGAGNEEIIAMMKRAANY